MRYVIFIFAILFIISILLIDDEKLNKKFKILITAFLVLVSVLAYLFEQKAEQKGKDITTLQTHFVQGGMLECEGVDVNISNFDFSFATASFIAKKSTPSEFKNLIFDAKKCQIK